MNALKYFILLPDRLVEKILMIPETGMGYHLVDLLLTDGTKIYRRIITNSETLILLSNSENLHGDMIKDILPRDYNLDKQFKLNQNGATQI